MVTSVRLAGRVAVAIVIVRGPTRELQFSQAEQTQVVAEVQTGLTWLGAQEPTANVSWHYEIRDLAVGVEPDSRPNEDWTHGPYYGSRGTFFADVTGDGRADAIVVNDNTVVVRRAS